MTSKEKIFIKNKMEECLYCPTCGKKEVHISAVNPKLFCCTCGFEFIMMEPK